LILKKNPGYRSWLKAEDEGDSNVSIGTSQPNVVALMSHIYKFIYYLQIFAIG